MFMVTNKRYSTEQTLGKEERNVISYKKHGKYYYAHGYKPVKKLSRYKATDGHKFAG